jgi:hypothetical protein
MRSELAAHRLDNVLDAFGLDYFDDKATAESLFG